MTRTAASHQLYSRSGTSISVIRGRALPTPGAMDCFKTIINICGKSYYVCAPPAIFSVSVLDKNNNSRRVMTACLEPKVKGHGVNALGWGAVAWHESWWCCLCSSHLCEGLDQDMHPVASSFSRRETHDRSENTSTSVVLKTRRPGMQNAS